MSLNLFNVITVQLPRVLVAGLLGLSLCAPAGAQDPVDPRSPPAEFVKVVGNNALDAVKRERSIKSGDLAKINQLIDQYVLPYVNFTKTTRLAAGRYWRQANAQQQKDLVQAFKGTLIRTYSGALQHADPKSVLTILPFRGDANADDVVVRSTLTQSDGQSFGIDYRLEKTQQGWKIYDLNVEGIWLIQNYRNQFAQQISQNGIDGLIKALNERNAP